MRVLDFSLKMYAEICQALKLYKVVTVEEYLSQKTECPFVILRHDVDRELGNALAMAELEHRHGIKSTYYFRYPRTFNIEILRRISNLGHEIGYHYEVLDKARGNRSKAIEIFQQELSLYRRYFPVKTVCRHGNPLSKWDGREIWECCDFKDFDLLGEAYLSCAGISIYLTDTGRNWNGIGNVKDTMGPKDNGVFLKNTTELVKFLRNNQAGSIYLNCHPERWGPGTWGWLKSLIRDQAFNLCKMLLQG